MFPYLFKIGFFELRIYSLMYIIGLLLTIYFTRKRAEKFGIKPAETENFIIFTFIIALLGARMYYVAFRWDYYGGNPLEMIAIWHGGLAIHGGIIGGFIAALSYCWYKKINPLILGDAMFPFLLLSQGLGRFGNFANGEAHGVPTMTPPDIIFRLKNVFPEFWSSVLSQVGLQDTPRSVSILSEIIKRKGGELIVNFEGKAYYLHEYFPWGISFPSKYRGPAYMDFGTLPVHPTFFYEMILNFIGFALLLYFWKKDKIIGTGMITGGYLILYGVIRGFVTTFRADDLMLGAFRAPHLLSVIMVVVGIGFILNSRRLKGSKTAG
ncbi:prolipoprotein diacylglyceryl transferase [Limisalsivibrio acetivorans]|uniref:prolipoprotein diacylglyceryl transferase n=1 Tax=Limisalsivibrio acetivorans TaxID=1304888 RepID=UPI0003B3B759|nr:prolipoprotein diacylglyceryl transferase [Limisalsivibrio acetivorans]